MIHLRRILFTLAAGVFLWGGFPEAAHAYIDPGTGSYILQLLLAGIVGAAYAVKVYWRNLRSFLSTVFRKQPKE